MSLFDQYTDLLNTEATGPLVSIGASLEPLDRIEAGLADRARRYVMDGTDPQLLLGLPRHAEAAHWLGFPGYRLPVISPARTRVVERARAERYRYFSQALDGPVPIVVLERFGRLMQAVRSHRVSPFRTRACRNGSICCCGMDFRVIGVSATPRFKDRFRLCSPWFD
jgi:hypothetical protein